MKKVLFIDRDGTLIREPEDQQIDRFTKLTFYPGALQWLARIAAETDYELVMVTNQDGLGTDAFPEEDFWPVQNFILDTFAGEGVHFAQVLIDRSFPWEEKDTRKPGIGLLGDYLSGAYDLADSVVIGDRSTDVELAARLKSRSVFIGKEQPNADLCTEDWADIYRFLCQPARVAELRRVTNETDISVQLNLDGSGKARIETGLGFFDHMLDQLARHGHLDLDITAKGDLSVDEHHTIEDTALVLGTAFRQALGDKKGIMRYGFLLPMDDCLAQVALDFGGRPWLVWEADFTREKIGDMPTEMFLHFFKSFSDAAACNLNIRAEGQNEHHKIESIFKAFALAVRMAVSRTGKDVLPTTKGSL